MKMSSSLCSTLLLIGIFPLVSGDQKSVTAVSGQDVILPCQVPNNHHSIIIVEWSRADLETDYVLVYRDENFIPEDQHESFKNRVDLQDRQMKDDDVSLILKNVTTADSGSYKCYVVWKENDNVRHSSIIFLSVAPPGQTGGDTEDEGKEDGGKEATQRKNGSVGLKVCLTVFSMLLLVAVGFAV
ncbi:V-set domain-containing T-cell activation inhibitor 1-like isoform X2 [Neolamprologus brichardi]|uniref:V-set domain-containing T-cell activation inhibitor 1-like isoform X2 n=1 Tax=Neolamprologus brichardi TaxID=32507 RepID=UPI001643F724|nr:V-set domain-containing T-cell activation inhibitor 1-like isoform X2 [Neolamprologus brichardi]